MAVLAGPEYEPGVVLVAFRGSATAAQRAASARTLDLARDGGAAPSPHFVRMHVGPGTRQAAARALGAAAAAAAQDDVQAAVEALRRDPNVRVAEPDFIARGAVAPVVPNDELFPYLYGLHNTGQSGGVVDADVDAADAWAGSPTRGAGVVVAVIDSGVDYNHPDLSANILRRSDGSVVGYDYRNGDADPMDDLGHGTHCAGTIAAVANNGIGIAGVAPAAKIMPLKFLGTDNFGFYSDAVACIDYAIANGARVMSNSWGGSGHSQLLLEAVQLARTAGIVFTAAAMNGGADGVGDNNDNAATPMYPANYSTLSDNVITVAATDHFDGLASFSNYGPNSVNIAAPGVNVLSTVPNGGYQYYSGTSMATPHVSGAVALLLSAPATAGLTLTEVRARLATYCDKPASLAGKVSSGGRLNVLFALQGRKTWSISGRVTDPGTGQGVGGLPMAARLPDSNSAVATTETAADGSYTLSGIDAAYPSCLVSGGKAPRTLQPSSRSVNIGAENKDRVGIDFAAPVTMPIPVSINIDSSILGGSYNAGKKMVSVTLSAPAPAGGAEVAIVLSGQDPDANKDLPLTVPGVLSVPEGAVDSEAAPAVHSQVDLDTRLKIEATCNGVTISKVVTITAAKAADLFLSAASAIGGQEPYPTGTVTLDVAAPITNEGQGQGVKVALTSSDSETAAVPASVTVAPGSATATFSVTTSSVTVAKTVTITATTGGVSKTATLTVNPVPDNPVPALSSLSPSSATAGGAGFTLTVTGSGFVGGSVVRWNGSYRPTAYISTTELRASIPASDLAAVASASVTVASPAPGGGNSNVLLFHVTAPATPTLRLQQAPSPSVTRDAATGDLLVSFRVANVGTGPATNVAVTRAKLGTYTLATGLPQAVGATVAAGASQTVTLRFPPSAAPAGSSPYLSVGVTSDQQSLSGSVKVGPVPPAP